MTNNWNSDSNPNDSAISNTTPQIRPSSRNAEKHGLTSSNFCLLHDEDQNLFEQHRKSIEQALAPRNIIEAIHVLRIVETSWLMFRASLVEAKTIGIHMEMEKARIVGDAPKSSDIVADLNRIGAEYICYRALEDLEARSKALDNINRYRTTHERAFHKNLNALQKLRGPSRPLIDALPATCLGILSGDQSIFDLKPPSATTPNPASQTTETKPVIEYCETKFTDPEPTPRP